MTKFTDIKYNYLRKEIEGQTFIKVEIKDKKFGLIDIRIFHKDGDKYQAVENFDLPKVIIDELMNNDSYTQDLSIAEVYNLDKYMEDQIEKIKELNDMDNRISNVLNHYYTVIREEKMFLIKTFNSNQFGAVRETALNPRLIPYIICDLIEINPKYNNNLFYFDGDIFGQISEVDDLNLLSVFKVDVKTGECNLDTIYKLDKKDGKWNISLDIHGIEDIIEDEIKKFVKKLEN